MKVAAAQLKSTGRTSVQRLCATLLLLLAFTLQSYITQTHIHHTSPATPAIVGAAVSNGAASHGASPADHEAAACPFCQAIVVAGAFFTPAPLILGPPSNLAVMDILRPIVVGLATTPAGFSWRSRAPPQH